MAEELGKIERPLTKEFRKGRKLFFVPLIYRGKESPSEYLEKVKKYWEQADEQLADLELKLGRASKIYHELVPSSGEAGVKAIKELNDGSYQIVKGRVEKGAQMEAIEDGKLLTEFMDWSRCLAVGLQSRKVFNTVYQSYVEAGKRRNESIAKRLDETLKADEIGLLFMQEGHQVQFPRGIEVFYVAPPALDEINRWLRDYEVRKTKESDDKTKDETTHNVMSGS
jgi:hypothetical protein